MTINLTMAVVLAALYAAGFYLIMQRSLMRVILGIVLLGHGANLFLQVAGGPPGAPPFIGMAALDEMSDPLPQAMALTAIVITFGLLTFLLALAYRSWVLLGHDEVRDDLEDRRIAEAVAEAQEMSAAAETTEAEDPEDPEDTRETDEPGESGGNGAGVRR
ncbi:Na(+)/H(+) antiporter subunit C [Amycolatopsis aidingensis]|uniref:Na(+)/H(+) antiporter subunit C n=1 Tax=Amycolatopsis aidingensis TaxID=2842453 RepID=UPI001C0A9999|nr:Na(+)/H(+) antiporter subunit C [Amycolatopsis aidingensis]